MILETITYRCRVCNSQNIVKNGSNRYGQPQYWRKECGARRMLKPKRQALAKKSHQPEGLPRT